MKVEKNEWESFPNFCGLFRKAGLYKSTRNRRKSRMLINELKIDQPSSIDKAEYNIFQDKCINFKFH